MHGQDNPHLIRYLTMVRLMIRRGKVYINMTMSDWSLLRTAQQLGYAIEGALCTTELTELGRTFVDVLGQS